MIIKLPPNKNYYYGFREETKLSSQVTSLKNRQQQQNCIEPNINQ